MREDITVACGLHTQSRKIYPMIKGVEPDRNDPATYYTIKELKNILKRIEKAKESYTKALNKLEKMKLKGDKVT